jgi:hypothetical protein
VSAPRIAVQKLRSLRTFDDVLEFLADELDWPVDGVDPDDAVFNYTPDELGIPADQVPSLRSISQLRPLTNQQPWGIFFLEFAGPRLPITPLRRLLEKLVTARRATRANNTWKLEHLLFIVTSDTGESVEFHFVAFRVSAGHAAELRSLPWRPQQSPKLYLERLATELLPCLTWPSDPHDAGNWATKWQKAFALRHGEVIANADRLAQRMADAAAQLRKSVETALAKEGKSGPFHRLLASVHEELVAGVDGAGFADMCAQTLVYGTLTARVTDPDGFGASPTLTVVPLANPFLAAFFEQVHDQVVALELPDGGLEALVADLRSTNVEAILDRFGDNSKGGDPVVHFYEEFLKRYDAKMRADAGAFYTPQPVVEFMVRAVDQVLKDSFGMSDGLADKSTWEEVCGRLGTHVPKGIDAKAAFLSMIDPATGTGTFLVEWLRRAEVSFRTNHHKGGWAELLSSFVLPSMHAFEVMLAPYAIAHLKVALEAHSQGIDGADFAIYLTDTLEHPAAQASFENMNDPLAEEGHRAAALKQNERFTVVIGNPPYDREQREVGDGGRRKGGVVRHGAAGIPALINDITKPMIDAGLGLQVKNLYNDYVYFWRWAAWKSTELDDGPAVVAFISASSFLDGKSMGGLRSLLRKRFDTIYVVDLGGQGRGGQTEENVFDIRTPVCITIAIRTNQRRGGPSIRYTRISGSRSEKLHALRTGALAELDWTDVGGVGLDSLIPLSDSDYYDWPELTHLFPWCHSGAQFKRTWPIAPSTELLKRRWDELLRSDGPARAELFKESRDRGIDSVVKTLDGRSAMTPLAREGPRSSAPPLVEYAYRSFDRMWCIADPRVGDYLRAPLWLSLSEEQLFLTTLTSTKIGRGPVVTATPYVPDLDHFSGRGAKNIIPLWRDSRARQANVTAGLLDLLSGLWGRAVSAADLLAYVYGLCATEAFYEQFAEEISTTLGPVRLPLTTDGSLAHEVVRFGSELLWLHTWGERGELRSETREWRSPVAEVEPITSYPERFSYDEASQILTVGSGQFGPVSSSVWNFEVSGLKPLQTWLGRRMAGGRGRRSSVLDDLRPDRWTFTGELIQVVDAIDATVERSGEGRSLLSRVIAGPVLPSSSLPIPGDAEMSPP